MLVDAIKLLFEELVAFQIKAVILSPLLLLFLQISILPLAELDASVSIAHDVDQAENHRALCYREGDWFDQIPTKPFNPEDSVSTGEELSSIQAGKEVDPSHVLGRLLSLDYLPLLFRFVKLGLSEELESMQLEHLFAHNGVLKEARLLDESIADIVNSD